MTSAGSAARDKVITIGRDFSEVPGGRYKDHGSFSGQEFRDEMLVPALRAHDKVIVYLDGTAGYAGSFLEESFGGLIRVAHFSFDELRRKLTIAARDPRYEVYRRMAESYLRDAAANAKPA